MAVIGSNYLTLADWAKRLDPDGKVSLIVDLLSQANEMMEDMLWTEANMTSGNKTGIRTGLPAGTWRQMYQGVQPTKSTTAQIVDNCGNLEAYSQVDKDLADMSGNAAEFRLTEDSAFYEGMTQQMQSAFIYSNSLNTPSQIMGIAPRYSTTNSANAATAQNVIDMGGTGNTNTSVYFVQWGTNTCFGMFPKNKMAGLQMEDLGRHTQVNADGSMYEVYRSHFKWESGLVVRDWRYIIRLANIDVTQLNGSNSANLISGLIRAAHRFPTAPRALAPVQNATRPSGIVGMGNAAIYCNRQISTALDLQAVNKSNVLLTQGEWGGMAINMFRGCPIRTVDAILSTEGRVT